jgi:hypothetical protein
MASVSPFACFAKPLGALGEWLLDNHYSQHAAEAIVGHTAAEGTPTGSPYLDREDEPTASEVFVEAMEAVPFDDPAWGDPGPGDSDRSVPAGAAIVPTELLDLAPICGGGPEPFEPSEGDWEDYRRWAAEVEARARAARTGEALYGYE